MAMAMQRPAVAPEPEMSILIQFAGQVFEPLLSGALYWRAENALATPRATDQRLTVA